MATRGSAKSRIRLATHQSSAARATQSSGRHSVATDWQGTSGEGAADADRDRQSDRHLVPGADRIRQASPQRDPPRGDRAVAAVPPGGGRGLQHAALAERPRPQGRPLGTGSGNGRLEQGVRSLEKAVAALRRLVQRPMKVTLSR